MTFTERPFLYFFLVVYLGWLLLRRRENWSVPFLLAASLVFYGHNHWSLLPLLVAYTVVNWHVARRITVSPRPKRTLAVGVAFNLLTLAFFKYTPLLVETSRALGLTSYSLPAESWQIPYGISFYAFTGIAYMVDVYRRSHAAVPSLSRYALSAAFFPHLVAGPILRPNEFLNRLAEGQLPRVAESPFEAVSLIARGYFKKVVLADRIAIAIDPYFSHVGDLSTAGVWSLPYVYLYALQIYFDFSAYSDIARGLAMLFGYRWPENFDRPYLATSVAEFWRRWHITLSRFLRDYLFIPLGGSRGGWWKTNRNLMVTMLLGGLWHGASWSFLVWGGLHGTFLVVHRFWSAFPLRDRLSRTTGAAGLLWKGICIVATFHAVCLAWCFFRLTVLSESLACVRSLVRFDPAVSLRGPAYDPSLWGAVLCYGVLSWIHRETRHTGPVGEAGFRAGFAWSYTLGWFLLAQLLAPAENAGVFIYFQF